MAIYNTDSDSENTAVRAFLTKVGEKYLGRRFNTSNGWGQKKWLQIKEITFQNRCAYCGIQNQLQMEHLVMFNRNHCGLHHPGNIVPACKKCNSSRNREASWEQHLEQICRKQNKISSFQKRLEKIKLHIQTEEYPKLDGYEVNAIKIIAESLYKNIKMQGTNALELYGEIQSKFLE